MTIFRELTSEEKNRRTLITQAATSHEAMRQLESEAGEVDLALAVGKVVVIMQSEPDPFPHQEVLHAASILNPASKVGHAVHSALGRAMQMLPTGMLETPEDITTCILADVHAQAQAAVMVRGLEEPEYAATLDPSVQRIVGYAREDDDVKVQIQTQADGDYHKLDRYSQEDLRGDLTGGNLPASTKEAISRFYGVDDYRFEHSSFTQADIQRDATGNIDRVTALLGQGTTTGVPAVDTAVTAVYDRVVKDYAAEDPEHESAQFQRVVMAGARLLTLQERGTYVDPKAGAAIVLNDIGIQRHAAYQVEHERDSLPDLTRTHNIAMGQWHKLDANGLGEVSFKMNEYQHVATVEVLTIQDTIIKQEATAASQRLQYQQDSARQQAGMGM